MRQLAYLGVAALTAVALLGTSCSSDEGDDTNNAVGGAVGTGGVASTSTGGKSSAATTTTKANTGGATSSATTAVGGSNVGGVTSTGTKASGGASSTAGGSTGVGGASSTGGTAVIEPTTGGLSLTDGFYEEGKFHGAVWVTSDSANATRTDVPHTTLEFSDAGDAGIPDEMCVIGFAPKIALKANPTSTSDYDYSEIWGADLGWNLNQDAAVDGGEAGAQNPADFSDVTSVTVNLVGATGLNMRVQLETRDAEDKPVYYCATLPLTNLPSTVQLNTLKTECWKSTGNVAFDPTKDQPVSFALAIVTSATKEYPISFCVTDLKFNTEADGG